MIAAGVIAQSRHSSRYGDMEGTIVNVVATRTDSKKEPIKIENLYLYENGLEQKIKNFSYDPSPSRIVLLVDNSKTVGADIEKLKSAVMEFAYEIFDGDQLFSCLRRKAGSSKSDRRPKDEPRSRPYVNRESVPV